MLVRLAGGRGLGRACSGGAHTCSRLPCSRGVGWRVLLTAGGLGRRCPLPLRKAVLGPEAAAAARPLEAGLLKPLLVVWAHELVEACGEGRLGLRAPPCGHRAEPGALGSRATQPHLL